MSLSGVGQWFSSRGRDIFIRPSARYQALDGIRAISMLMIIVFHCWMGVSFFGLEEFERFNAELPVQWLWITKSDFAVDAFFVMSGFLIGNILMKELQATESINLKLFYIKRLYRLYPAYLLLIAIAAIPALLTDNNGQPAHHLIYNLLYISNFLPHEEMPLDWSWTLCVEEQFYILMPLILLACRRYRASTLFVLGILYILSYGIRFWLVMLHPQLAESDYAIKLFLSLPNPDFLYIDVLDNKLHVRYGAIITGVIGAYFYVHCRNQVAAFFHDGLLRNNLALLMALVLIGICVFTPTYRPSFYQQDHFWFNVFFHTASRNLFSLGILLLIFCSLYPRGLSHGVNRLLGSPVWYPVAQLSYSLYLFHLPFSGLVGFIGIKTFFPETGINVYHVLLFSLLTFLASAIFAILVFTFIERPFMVLRDRRYGERKSSPPDNTSPNNTSEPVAI